MRYSPPSQKGSLILVVLCLLAVLGIGLAAFLSVSNQAMKLSNRSFQTGLSAQLAEMGLEEGLRAFNKNDWSDWSNGATADWTVSGTTATCNLTFPAGKFGQGVTGSVKIRVDNYNANQLNSTWSSAANYRINDLVGYNGIWYRCVQNHSNQTPGNLAYWVQAPIPWTWINNNAYAQYAVVNYNGTWYRCHTAHTSSSGILPTNTSYWSYIPAISLSWSSGTSYPFGTMLFDSGIWYYCFLAHTSSATITPTNTTYWAPVLKADGTPASPVANTYFISTYYLLGDYIYRVGSLDWFRCVAPQPYQYASGDFGINPPWVPSSLPYISWAWRSGVTYSFNDLVFYSASGSGSWYRCKIASTTATPTTTTDWENALTGSMWAWSSGSINYNLGDAVYYSGTSQRYRCILAHTSSGSITPTNTTYWSSAPLFSTAWDSGKQYTQNDTVRYNGVWYLSLQNSNTNQNPVTATTYWVGANTSTTSYQWNATTAYTTGNYKCYGGVWYKCLSGNTGNSPNNTTYWTAAWANSFGVTTGAPVVYAEGTVNLTGSPSIKTQLRATIAPAPLFPNAAATTTTINANSGGTVDSYDSTTGTVANQGGATSIGGLFNTGTYVAQQNTSTNYSAVLAAGYTAGTAITLASTAVKGYLAAPSSSSSPYAPLYSSGGSVKGFSSPASPNIDLTRLSRSPYIPQFDTVPGGAGGLAAAFTAANFPKGTALVLSTTTNIGTPGATTPARYYYNGNLTIGSASIQFLKINGPVILYVNGDFFISNPSSTGRVDISTTGSAEIHVAGRFMADAGGEGILNYTSDPKSVIIICDTTSTSTHFYSEGVNDFYGVIYVPYSTSTTGYYNDNTATEIFGAVSASKITYSGANLNIHYDTSLRYTTFGGVDQPFAVSEWRELTDATELATMP